MPAAYLASVPMSISKAARIPFLDTFRFVAVTFALLAHVCLHHGLDRDGTISDLLRTSLTRTATPSLLVLFGVMLEIVYARRFTERPLVAASRMVYRAALCYLAFAASALVALVGGEVGVGGFLGSVILLTSVPYAAIFKLYLFLLLLGIGVVAARARYGVGCLLAIVGPVWLADALWIDGSGPLPPPFRHLGGLLLGWGENHGPSVLHGTTLVVFGMALGGVVFSPAASRPAKALLALLLAAAATVLSRELWGEGPRHLLAGIADITAFRSDNDIVYYAFGIWAAVLLMGAAYVLHLAVPARLRRLAGRLGPETFAYFFIGNAVLLLMPHLEVQGALRAVTLVVAHLVVFCALTLLWLGWTRDNPLLSRAEAWGQAQAQALTMRIGMRFALRPPVGNAAEP